MLIFFLYLYSIEIPSHPGMNEAVTTVISACFVFTKEKAVLSSMTCRMIVVVTLELRLCVNICIQISMEGTKSAFNFAQQGIHNWPTKVLNYSRSATNPLEFHVALSGKIFDCVQRFRCWWVGFNKWDCFTGLCKYWHDRVGNAQQIILCNGELHVRWYFYYWLIGFTTNPSVSLSAVFIPWMKIFGGVDFFPKLLRCILNIKVFFF